MYRVASMLIDNGLRSSNAILFNASYMFKCKAVSRDILSE